GSYELLLESASGEHQLAHSEGLVSFLAKQKGLQMVFLNGCSSQQQALDLLEAGVPAVVGTSQKINDDVATGLSLRFYKGLSQGATIDRAWAEAVDQVKVEKGAGNFRDLFGDESDDEEAPDRFPWEIYFREGAEVVKDWNLPEAVQNPLFGLPPIPKTHDLPETPFLFLKRYEREHAEIFFGRSYYIRELYNRVSDTKSPPVILLYGQSGVGKSSLFDAGLNPRLEKEYKVIYIRRIQEKGLAGTLEYALVQELGELGESSQPVSEEPEQLKEVLHKHNEAFNHIEAAAQKLDPESKQEIEALIQRLKNDQAFKRKEPPEGGTTNQLPATSSQHRATSLWQSIETSCKKPLILILDQVEELYTRPNEELTDELADFLLALRSIFGSPAQRPQGKLILGYRKEYHPEIEEGFKTFLLPRCTVFLEPLRRKDILEVFRGVSQTAALKQFYNLSVEDDLPVIIADDLLEDRESPVAPVLQIVLTKMWNAAKKENSESPRFTISQYQQLKKDGIAMGEFFEQQMR
ncbi:MAG: AAA family ATPase, partial [bacterium]